jgi:hypothetical protein
MYFCAKFRRNPSRIKGVVGIRRLLHVPHHRQELERNFEIVLSAENTRIERKSSANESQNLPPPVEPSFAEIKAELRVQ